MNKKTLVWWKQISTGENMATCLSLSHYINVFHKYEPYHGLHAVIKPTTRHTKFTCDIHEFRSSSVIKIFGCLSHWYWDNQKKTFVRLFTFPRKAKQNNRIQLVCMFCQPITFNVYVYMSQSFSCYKTTTKKRD